MSPGIRETKFRFEQQAQGSQHPPLSEERSTPLSTAEPGQPMPYKPEYPPRGEWVLGVQDPYYGHRFSRSAVASPLGGRLPPTRPRSPSRRFLG